MGSDQENRNIRHWNLLFKEASFKGMRYVIDADLQNYFGSIDHQSLRSFLDRRIKDGVIRKMIDKWLKAGIMDKGQVSYPREERRKVDQFPR
ncbi:MAG: hypothetical protein EOP48_05345 [Sphingobacteriales bacterium]|nr:MAG: hypothetical protein EOP48_05345 [Sphingobacteriales bacterium]